MSLSDLSFDDLIPSEEKKRPQAGISALSFDDLIPKDTTAAGLGKTALSAVPKGIFGALGAVGDLGELGKSASQWLAQKMTGKSPDEVAAVYSKYPMLGPLGSPMPTSQNVRDAVETFTGKLPLYEPQTRAEKTVDTAVQMMAGLGKPSLSTLGKVVAPATAGTEIAGALTNDNPWTRVAGGLLGGGTAAVGNAWRGVGAKAVAQAVGDVTPAQAADALRAQAQARSLGIPLMGAEAMPNSGVQQLASDVMASRTGAPIMRSFLDERPGQVRGAVGGLLGGMAPYRSPGEIAQLAEKTAADVLSGKNSESYMALGSNKARTAQTSPFWEQQRMADLAATEAQSQAQSNGAALQAQLDAMRGQLPTRQASLNDVVQQFGQMQARANEMRQLAAQYDNPGARSMLGVGALKGVQQESAAASSAAADFAGLLPQRRAEVSSLQNSIGKTQAQLDAMRQPAPSDLDHGLQSIIGNIDSEIALAGPRTDKGKILNELKSQLGGLTTPTQVDNVYQAFSKRLNPGALAPPEERIAAGILAEPVKALGALTEQVSGPIAAGRRLYAQITQDQVNPLRSSLIGKMAPKEGFYDPADPTNLNRITGTLTKGADSAEIRQLYTHMNAQDATAFPAVARGMLEAHFDQATKRLQGGENVKLGANFANDVRGTDQQRANLNEILRGVADAHNTDPKALVSGANVLMDTLSATGKIPGVGSQTAGRLGTQAQLTRNPVSAASEILSAKPLGMAARGADAFFNARRNAQLAEWLTAPDSVETILKMAKLKPDGVTARFYLAQLLNARKESQSEN